VLDRLQNQPEALAPLQAGGVVHHVLGDEIIEHRLVVRLLSPGEFLDDISRAAVLAHLAVPLDSSTTGQGATSLAFQKGTMR